MRHDHDGRRPALSRRSVWLPAYLAACAVGLAAIRAPGQEFDSAGTPATGQPAPAPAAPPAIANSAQLPVTAPADVNTAAPESTPAPAFGPDFDLNEAADDLITVGPIRQKLYEALVNVQEENYAQAIPKLEWVLKEDPSQMLAWQSLGWAYLGMDRKNDALQLWGRLQALAPNEPMSYNCLAMAASDMGDNARAEDLYRRSLELDPDQDHTRFNYYKTLVWQGKLDEAIPGLKELLAKDPGRTDVRRMLAQALIAPHNYEQALEHWENLTRQFPDNSEFALSLAMNLLLLGDVEIAAAEAQRVLEMDPENIMAANMLADIAEFSNKPEKAVVELRKRIDTMDDKATKSVFLLRLASLLNEMNTVNPAEYPLTRAIAVAGEAVDANPLYTSARLFMGELLAADRQYSAARKVYEYVLKEHNRDNIRAKIGLFEICIATHQLDEAEKWLKDVQTRFDPYNPYRYYHLARLEFERGNYADGMMLLDRLEEGGSAAPCAFSSTTASPKASGRPTLRSAACGSISTPSGPPASSSFRWIRYRPISKAWKARASKMTSRF